MPKDLSQHDIDNLKLIAGYGAGPVSVPREDFEALVNEVEEGWVLSATLYELEEAEKEKDEKITELKEELQGAVERYEGAEATCKIYRDEIEEMKSVIHEAGLDLA